MNLLPGKEQIKIIPIEIYTVTGPQQGQAKIQEKGIFISGLKTEEIGITWEELKRLIDETVVKHLIDRADRTNLYPWHR